MNPLATKYGASPLPQVNLVPQDINDKRIMGLVRTFASLAVLAAVVLVGLAFFGAYTAKNAAKDSLDSAFTVEDNAVAERDAKRSVYEDYVTQETSELTLTQIGWAEMSDSDLVTSILAQVNTESSFESLHVYGPNANGIGGPEVPSVFSGGVGRLDFVAETRSYEEGLALIARLEAVPGLAKVYGTSKEFGTSPQGTYWEVSGSAVITPLLLTGRLNPTDGIVDQSILEAITVPLSVGGTPSPAPSVEPTAGAEGGN